MFITIDGIDCCGKDTQVAFLSKWLKPNLVIWCPNRDTPIGKLIDGFLRRRVKLPRMAQIALFEANRWEWCEAVRRCLDDGGTVVANRWFHSGMAYALASGKAYLKAVEALITGMPFPDISIIIDISVNESLRRKAKRDTFESNLTLLNEARSGFLLLAKKYGWAVVNGEQPPEDLFREIQLMIKARFEGGADARRLPSRGELQGP